jgi:hypothetical protein
VGHDANSEGFNKVAMLRAVDRPRERDSNDLRAINEQEAGSGAHGSDTKLRIYLSWFNAPGVATYNIGD